MFKKLFKKLNESKIKRLEAELNNVPDGMLKANIEFEIKMRKENNK